MIKRVILSKILEYNLFRNVLNLFWPVGVKKVLMYDNYLHDYIISYYPIESINERRFYNIGAGNQRSKFNFWSYIDMAESKYSKQNIDYFCNLELKEKLPLPENQAEIVYNSFLIEHISVEATKNLCNEAYRVLKKGGVFHSKVHCYDYSYLLLKKGILSPKIPFENRESASLVNDFLIKHKGKCRAFFDENKNYVICSTKNVNDKLVFTPETTFLYHNAGAAVEKVAKSGMDVKKALKLNDELSPVEFYKNIKDNWIDEAVKMPHQHNSDYFSKDDLRDYLLSLGFSEVYFTQAFQSVSPALWEDVLNNSQKGFVFAIEAIK